MDVFYATNNRSNVRPKEKPRERGVVPDVRGYTELAARRKLGQAGFRVEVMDQATENAEDNGRVIAQLWRVDGNIFQLPPLPGKDPKQAELGALVTLLLGRSITQPGKHQPDSLKPDENS